MYTSLKKDFDKGKFQVGASLLKVYCWYAVSTLLFKSGILPFSSIMVSILRAFGASIGKDVRIKPGIHIRYPWKLILGDHSWLADCYIDNLDFVTIGKNACISQQAMLMTGNHDYKSATFDLITTPIIIEDGVWLGAKSLVSPGVRAGSHSVLTAGSTAVRNLEPFVIYQGNPAIKIRARKISQSPIDLPNNQFYKKEGLHQKIQALQNH
jgi:putative colanic acid biosynthesis acetyltransferase WcaF